jgi:hypothetical protein
LAASFTTVRAACSQDSLLLPISSITLYMLSGIEASIVLCSPRHESAVEKLALESGFG